MAVNCFVKHSSKRRSHQVIFDCLKRSGVVHVAASEENPVEIDCEYLVDQQVTATTQSMTSGTADMSQSNQDAADLISDIATPGFSVAFDPLDGSSIVDANFAVGTIVGVWPGNGLLGRRGREQVLPD